MADRPPQASVPAAPVPRWRSDLWAVLVMALLCFVVSSAFNLHEAMVRWLAHYERWQADELPLSIGVLAVGLAWYAMRRRTEVMHELARREAAEQHASALLAHNRELAQQLISVQENERRALARELHDELGQRCSALLVETAGLRRASRDDPAAPLLPAASRAHMAAQGVYQLVSDMLRRLRPANLDALGLVAALQELCETWELRSGVSCVFHHDGPCEGLTDELDITIYRIVQESLTNVARHAAAGGVQVRLVSLGAAELLLSIQDDGRGMDTRAARRGLGLLGAAERAAAIGGELQLVSEPGAGLRVQARLPRSRRQVTPPAGASTTSLQPATMTIQEAA